MSQPMGTLPTDRPVERDRGRTEQRTEQRVPQRRVFQIRTAGNRFDLDLSKKPPHMDYQWNAVKVLGAENTEHMIDLEANGWTPVPASRHPELSGRMAKDGAVIERGGQQLHERPVEWSEQARELDGFAARSQVASQMQRLGLSGHRDVGRGVKREIGKIADDFVADD